MDVTFPGNYTFWANGTPLVSNAVIQSTKKIPNPNTTEIVKGKATVYDKWRATKPSKQSYDRPEYVS